MTTTSSKLAKITAVFFAILFVLSLVLTLFLYNIENTVFNPQTYKTALQDEEIYTRLPAVIGSQIALTAKENDNPLLSAVLSGLSASDWETLISTLLPPQLLQSLGEETIDSTFDFLNENSAEASLSLRDLKAQLTDPKSTNAIMSFLRTQPPCSATDLLNLATLAEGGEFILCQPPEVSMPLLQTAIEKELQLAANLLPEEKTFLQEKDKTDNFAKLKTLRQLMRLSPLISALFLLIVTFLVVRSPDTWLLWWGVPFLVTGIITAALASLTAPILEYILQLSPLGEASRRLSPEFMQLFSDILLSISQSLRENIMAFALFIALLGGLMVFGAKFIRKADEVPQAIQRY